MKKTHFYVMLSVLLMAVFCLAVSSCTSCEKQAPVPDQEHVVINFSTDYDGVLPDLSQGAEHIVSMHRQTMFSLTGGGEYVWYETKYTFADSLTAATLGVNPIVEVTSTFQTFNPELSYTITTNATKGTLIPAPIPGLWIEDYDLSNVSIKLSIADVMDRLKEWNGVLPPAKSVIIRKPVGPKDCNAQYVIGNPYDVIFVDAVTGSVTDWDPAFPRVAVSGPLGEWP